MAEVFQIKIIKAKKLNVDAYRMELLNALRAEGRTIKKELKKTVTTWRNKPDFEALIGLERGDGAASVLVGPVGRDSAVQHWVWTDQGTRPHIIRARRAPALRFRAGSEPKTLPKVFKSRRGRRFGPWRRPYAVRHPGTLAREWSNTLQKRRHKPFHRRMVKAMKSASARAF